MQATENSGAHHWIGSHAQRLECKWLDFTTGCAWPNSNSSRDFNRGFPCEDSISLSVDKLVNILADELADNRYSSETEDDDYNLARNMIAQADKMGLAYFVYKTCSV